MTARIGDIQISGAATGYSYPHRLTGPAVVDDNSSVRKARVMVVIEQTGGYWASTWSNSSGVWELRGLPPLPAGFTLSVIGYDGAGQYGAGIVSGVVQAADP